MSEARAVRVRKKKVWFDDDSDEPAEKKRAVKKQKIQPEEKKEAPEEKKEVQEENKEVHVGKHLVEVWTAHEVDIDWDDNDELFDGRDNLPEQKQHFLRHLTARAGSHGPKRSVPPLNKDIPISKFKKGMPLMNFLEVWATDDLCQKILTAEMRTEVQFLERNKETKEKNHPFFYKINLLWSCWSGMLMLEYCYPDEMDSCSSFPLCLHHMINHTLNRLDYVSGKEAIHDILKYLQSIQTALFPDDVTALRNSAANNFQINILNTINNSDWWLQVIGPPGKTAKDRDIILTQGPLKIIPLAAQQKKQASEQRQFSALTAPTKIHEVDFIVGVKKLVQEVYGADMDVTNKITINDTRHCASAMCLLQLLCGSRSLGIIGVNWFDKVTHSMESEIKNLSGITMKTVKERFNGLDYCIQVRRITKEKDKQIREYEEKKKIAKQKNILAEDVIMTPVSKNKVIVKPILFMFLDRKFLDQLYKNDTPLPPTTAVDIFLYLIQQTREYVRESSSEKKTPVEFVQSPLATPMWGYSDAETYQSTEKGNRQFSSQWNREMTKVLRGDKTHDPIFDFIQDGMGTHMLRRLYVNRGYYHFASNTLKETAFTRLTLGHKSFMVSLYYTSLIIEPSVSIDGTAENVLKHFETKVADLEARLSLLEANKTLTTHYDQNLEGFDNRSGTTIFIERLKRAARQSRTEFHVHRGIEMLQKLNNEDIRPTWFKLLRLGVHKSKETRVGMKNHPDFVPFNDRDEHQE